MSNPKLIQLASGQFLVGDVQAGDDGSIQIKDPMEVTIQPMQDPNTGQVMPQAAMFPFALMSKDRDFTFQKESIQLGPLDPDDSCANSWRKSTSGLVEANAGDLPPHPSDDPTKGGILLNG